MSKHDSVQSSHLEVENEKLQAQNDVAQQELKDLKNQITKMETQFLQDAETLRHQNQNYRVQIDELEQELDGLKSKNSEKETLHKQISELEENNIKLSSEHSRSKKSRDFFADQSDSKDAEILRLNADVENKRSEIEKQMRIIEGQKQQIET